MQNTLSDEQKLSVLIAQLADDKLGENTVILDLKTIDIAPADFFVITSCDSSIQVKSIADEITKYLEVNRLVKPRFEGNEFNEWVILDFFNVVIHIMTKKMRQYYKIEKLWADADFIKVNDEAEMMKINYTDLITELEKIEYED